MNNPSDNCDRKPLIALWYLHKTTEVLARADDESRPGLIRLQAYYLGLAYKYGVTADQVSDSLDITMEHASELMAIGAANA